VKPKIEFVEKGKRAPYKTVQVFLPYNKYHIYLIKKTIDGRKWNGEDKCWEIPLVHLPRAVDLFRDSHEIKVTPKLKELYHKLIEEEKVRRELREKEDIDIEIPGLKTDLYPFQRVGVAFADRTGGRCLIADQPGLGKTAQAIAYAQLHGLKTLVVCPLAVVKNWYREVRKFTGKESAIWDKNGLIGHANRQFHLINFDRVRKFDKVLRNVGYDLLVVDEATYLKNRNTLRYKSLLGSYRERAKFPGLKTKHAIFLTGTPIMSRPIEAFTLLNFLDNQRFNHFYHFIQKFGGWKGEPPKNLSELHERTKDLVIRRKKSEVLTELPDKQVNDIYVEIDPKEQSEYNRLLDELFGQWRFNGKPTIGTMPPLQIFLSKQKIPRLLEVIQEYLDNDRSILIFSTFIEPLTILKEELGDVASLYHGSMSDDEREEAIRSLAEGETKVGLLSIKAAGMGIDGLQNSIDTVVFLNMDWVPATHEQAEDRIHRIGQDRKVQVYYMIIPDTIDEYMMDILTEKRKIVAEAVDGELIEAINNKSFFNEFIRRLAKEHDF